MEGLLTFLLFGVAFYLMMRFGCGAHMKHGAAHSAKPATSDDDATSAIDPVCGMTVEAGHGFALEHKGTQYRFCSRHCFDQFEAKPEHYLSKNLTHDQHAGENHE